MGEERTVEIEAAGGPSEPRDAGAEEGPRAAGLGTKFFLAAALLVVATLGTALAVATWRANKVADRTIRDGLRTVPTMFRAYQTDLEGRLVAQVRSLADEAGTKSLYADVSAATRHDFATEQASLLGAKTVFMFDRSSLVLARSDKPEGKGVGKPFGAVKWVADPLWNRRDAAAAIIDRGTLALVASSSVVSGSGEEATIDGVLAASFPLGEEQIAALNGITRGDVAFIVNGARRDEPPKPEVAAATAGLSGEELLLAWGESAGAVERLFGEGEEVGPLELMAGGETRVGMGVPIKSASGKTLGAFVVTRSRSEETAAFREIRNYLLAIGLGMLILSLPVSFLMGRRIARPLEQLTRGALAIREGQLEVKLPSERGDEVGALSRAFNAMVGELKEKHALQELLEDLRRRPSEATVDNAGVTVDFSATGGAANVTMPGGPEPGKKFGRRYEILGMLGKGGFGEVFRANDVELEDVVAIKVLSAEKFAQGSQAVETLKREIRLARKITHPNVVRVHDLGEADGVRFVSMEYVPGTTLRDLFKRGGRLELGPGLQVIKQVSRGLDAIHREGILHRDMKPENVMVLPNGMVKLMDFGIAEAVSEIEKDAGKSVSVVGTPYYMSPEQLKHEKLDGRSDLYAVGVMMYEAFAGVLPFKGSTLTEVIKKNVLQVPESPAAHRPDLPSGLTTLIMSCLAKQAHERPAGAQVLYQRLLEIPSTAA